jgi:hypothetical protein
MNESAKLRKIEGFSMSKNNDIPSCYKHNKQKRPIDHRPLLLKYIAYV